MKRLVVGYARVSSADQAKKGFSITDQQAEIEEAAQRNGEKIDMHFKDPGKSGTNMRRKEVQELLKLVSEGKVRKIYIKYANRLSRDDTMIRSLRQVFYKFDVEVCSLNDDWADLNAPSDRKLSCDLVSRVDGCEPERTKKRTYDGLKTSVKSGNFTKGQVPLGFQRIPNPNGTKENHRTIEPIEEWRPIIDKIVYMILYDQRTAESIASYLNSIHALDRTWKAKEVLRIATRVDYYGGFTSSYYTNEEHHEGFYTKEIHDQLAEIIHKRRREKKYLYLFKGLIYCEGCGALLTCIPTLKKQKGKKEKIYLYYYCNKCKHRVWEDKLLPEVLFDFEHRLTDGDKTLDTRKKALEKIVRIKAEIDRIEDDYFDGLIDKDYLYEHRKLLQDKLKLSEKGISGMKKKVQKWIQMTRIEQRSSIKKTFYRIFYDFDEQCIKRIEFKKAKSTKN